MRGSATRVVIPLRRSAQRTIETLVARPPFGQPIDVLTGFLDERGNSQGRPVGVAVDKAGALLIADDVGNIIWRVSQAVK